MLPVFIARRQRGQGRRRLDYGRSPSRPSGACHSVRLTIPSSAALALAPRLQPRPQAEIKVGFLERLLVVAQRRFVGRQRYDKA